jgi:hypothetical protein
MVLSSALERAAQILASQDRSSDHEGHHGNHAEKVKFSTFKDAGHAAGQTRDDVVYWYLIQQPLHSSAYTSLGRVCTLRKVPTIRGCLGGLALMV